nr:MAG: NEDD4 family-interacting protein 1-like [Chiromantes dehaani nimavirus]
MGAAPTVCGRQERPRAVPRLLAAAAAAHPAAVPLSPPSLPDSPPSYEEVQRLKALEAAQSLGSGAGGAGGNAMGGGLDPETAEIELGTDFIFFVAFTVTFVFNVVGYRLMLCCSQGHTVAGHTGALAGFGFSVATWAVIATHLTERADWDWLMWFIMALCILICMCIILYYVYAKRKWHQVPRHSFFLV